VNNRSSIVLVLALTVSAAQSAVALKITSYYSPHERERPRRPATRYIVLHTTEGPKAGSLNKIHANGEAHYFVDRGGHVYRIISRKKIAAHAGRSMWNGKRNIDACSIGIEIVGYHNKALTASQYAAVKDLVYQLQRIYKISDSRVLCHAMVAYGAPNRWHRKSHRGRKRCGMLFARRSVRLKLGLDKQATFDPDVKAGRLVNADPYLANVLYGSAREQETAAARFAGTDANVISASRCAWDIARNKYNSSETVYVFPGGKRLRGDQVKNWQKIPPGTKVQLGTGQRDNQLSGVKEIGVDGASAREVAGEEYSAKTTVYLFPNGKTKAGNAFKSSEWGSLQKGTKVFIGYTYGGKVSAKKSAFDICGKRWNYPSTFYRLPDRRIVSGNHMDEGAIPAGTIVLFMK
jgi:N-acetylmuramoyl-L-alanine amidase